MNEDVGRRVVDADSEEIQDPKQKEEALIIICFHQEVPERVQPATQAKRYISGKDYRIVSDIETFM